MKQFLLAMLAGTLGLAAGPGPSDASSLPQDDLWWTGGSTASDRWTDDANWLNGVTGETGEPYPDNRVYVTTSDAAALRTVPAATIDDTMRLVVSSFYVGGWDDDEFGAVHGDPYGHGGIVEMTGGTLTSTVVPGVFPASYYMRIGYYGARGTLRQSGGAVRTSSLVSVGIGSPDSFGIYELRGGALYAYGIDLGVQATGLFDMTGGQYFFQNTNVGTGLAWEGDYEPGVGLHQQTGGVSSGRNATIALEPGSVGVMTIRREARVHLSEVLRVGRAGTGSVVQTGGRLSVGNLELGQRVGSIGTLSISGGVMLQFRGGQTFHVGVSGVGRLSVLGSGSTIQIAGRYRQSAASMLEARLEENAPHITTIEVGQAAVFASGSQIQVTRDEEYTPSPGQRFILLRSAIGVSNLGLRLVGEDAANWRLATDETSVTVTWQP